MNLESLSPMTFRVLFVAAFLMNFIIVGRYRKKAQAGERFDLSNEPPWMRYGLRIPAVLVLAYIVTYIVAPSFVGWSLIDVPAWLRLLGAAYALLLMPWLVHWTQRSLGKNVSTTVIIREDHELITTGPYRWVRHPLYVLGTLFYTSLALIMGSWLLMAGLAFGLVFVALRTPIEEAMLAERFGDDYRVYQSRTGRYFPRLFRGPRN